MTSSNPTTSGTTNPKQKIKIALSIDFDAISGWLGTSQHPDNNMADISSGYFSGYVGVPRLLKVFSRLGISDKVTWCIPGHSLETFPEQAKSIVESGAEIALHGYSHEGSTQMTAQQEKDVLVKTMALVENLTGKKPRGYRAPLYQIQERTVKLLQEHGFLWDSSLAHLDSMPYLLPKEVDKLNTIEFSPDKEASSWMKPSKDFLKLEKSTLVEIPCNWYMEDMTPMQFFPNVPNSQGFVDVRLIERMWMDRFEWLKSEVEDGREDMTIFALVLHPDTSGMAHVIGMIQRFLGWLKSFGDEVEFCTYEHIATEFANK
ncbi:polysaccharide deacetylase [Aureobasidium sp. EXF-12298]|nr:polysaccharide deacetylase [Aureobasidium sp. EXF-12298]KAI4752094.1 polysaccharide deacetylase [Aureobasidium sp. EXF-12344]KAI4782390.1 polysaccharide deacetylase [Aureobasidium sp. EXF-3400]